MHLNYSAVLLCCNVFLCMLNVSLCTDCDSPNSSSRIRRQAKTGSCTLPEYPENGYWSIGGPGKEVGVNTLLEFTCDHGYVLSSKSTSSVCEENGWNTAIPQCERPCSNLIGNEHMKVKCTSNGDDHVPCNEAIHGTQAIFECANYYEVSDKKYKRFCSHGLWDYPPPRCSPVCGIKPLTAEPLSNFHEENNTGEFPWVVAIYKRDGKRFQYIATGTLLSERIILTVAHAVSNIDGTAHSPSNYKIGVGKHYVGYNDNRDLHAQYSNIKKIILHSRYKGDVLRYSSDIGFLITETKLVLSKWVLPACITNLNYSMSIANTTGVLAGWGFAHGTLSEKLQKAHVLSKDHSTCMQELPSDWANLYLSDDKFCAGNSTKVVGGQIGCKGFSGSGLLTERGGRYFVVGIISVSHTAANEDCYIEQNSLYTNIDTHYNWITDILSEYSD